METVQKTLPEPVSLKEPNEEELRKANVLLEVMDSKDLYEDKDALGERAKLVDAIKKKVQQWIEQVASQKQSQLHSKPGDTNYGVQVLAFGGQAFGVVPKGGDLDVVCIAPRFVDRTDFFNSLVNRLQELKEVQNIRKVEAAHVPVLQFQISTIQVDLSLAVVRFERIPCDVDFASDKILFNMDHASVRSVSGIRDVKEMLSLVPNLEHFLTTIKVIKMWAKCNGIHGSVYGYPGGIAWAVMVARVCQMYPLACVSTLVYHFFQVFSQWNWPQPVILRPLLPPPKELHDTCVQWDSKKHASDRHHIMPVITPAFPEHNCCFAVNLSSKAIIHTLLSQAGSICEKIMHGQLEWDVLFQPVDFFGMYKHYLLVKATAGSTQGYSDWCGFLESQLRKLVEVLQVQPAIQQIHLLPKSYKESETRHTKWFLGIKLHKMSASTLDLSTPMQQFAEQSKSTAKVRGIFQDDMKIEILHVPRKHLGKHVHATTVT